MQGREIMESFMVNRPTKILDLLNPEPERMFFLFKVLRFYIWKLISLNWFWSEIDLLLGAA